MMDSADKKVKIHIAPMQGILRYFCIPPLFSLETVQVLLEYTVCIVICLY